MVYKTRVSSFCHLTLLFLVAFIQLKGIFAYECYVCKDQDGNNEKCAKTVRSCDIAENSCMTIVRWGGTPYWDPTGLKQYYVTKQCASSVLCEIMKQNTSSRCDRIWYNDWECVECCTGDRCNYYITLGASSIKPVSILTALVISATAFIIVNLRN